MSLISLDSLLGKHALKCLLELILRTATFSVRLRVALVTQVNSWRDVRLKDTGGHPTGTRVLLLQLGRWS